MLSLDQASQLLPNKPSHVTLWRWCRQGIKGIRLEHRRLGRTIFTSIEALDRFSQALAAADSVTPQPAVVKSHSPRQRDQSKDVEWAKSVLGYGPGQAA